MHNICIPLQCVGQCSLLNILTDSIVNQSQIKMVNAMNICLHTNKFNEPNKVNVLSQLETKYTVQK